MYSVIASPKVDLIFKKLAKKNPGQLEAIARKLDKVVENPHRFKPLSNAMKGLKRIHFGSFVLTYSIDETRNTITLEDYDHHDKIYKK